jgi:uncharacterized protein YecE (DUF72 family)
MNLYVGTSGYGYKEWKGPFYPEKLSSTKMLQYYSERFRSVELNNTFRRMPTPESLTALCAQVPEGFKFSLKAPQVITHFRRLKDVETQVADFKRATKSLGKHQGAVLFQLPPNFKKDVERLRTFLKLWGRAIPCAFEFRHESWFEEDVFRVLRDHSSALCVADEDDEPEAHITNTANWGYVRLRRSGYTKKKLTAWAESIRSQKWDKAFVYFKHEETGIGPRLAADFVKLSTK